MKLPEFFGLDIGNHSIKIAQVKHTGEGKAELVAIGHIQTPEGILTADDEDSKLELAAKIKQVKQASGISTKKVVAALPEAAIFSRIVMLPDLAEKELQEAIYYEAKQYLPTPVSEVRLDYLPINQVIIDGKNLLRALLIAAPVSLSNKYIDVISKAELELIALETESVATARTLTFQNTFDSSVLILDFGAKGTDISVLKSKQLIFSQSLGTGSDSLTKALMSDFSLDFQQAEQYKRTYGLLPEQAQGKVAASLAPVMQIIVNEINKTINYFRAHIQESTPKKIFVVGDGAKLPGLNAYLTQNLGIETQVTDPVASLDINSKIKSEVAQLSTVGFTVAVGLALKQE